jgi:hypothetical protein
MEITRRRSEILRSIFGVLSSDISTGEKPSGLGLPSRAQRAREVNRVLFPEAHVVLAGVAAGSRKGRKGNAMTFADSRQVDTEERRQW